MSRPLRALTSTKATVALLCVVAVLLLLTVAVPQAAVLGEEAFDELAGSRPWRHFVLVTLGLGRMSTSPVFLGVLAAFFLQLAAVLVVRAGPTWRRVRMSPPSRDGLAAWSALDEALGGPLPAGWSRATAVQVLRGHGFRVRSVDGRSLWAVKHRTAPLGFLLFHLSFFLLCIGGALIYYTRFVGTAVVTEGQEFSGPYGQVLREPPLGEPPSLTFIVEGVDPRSEGGEATHLGAVFRFAQAGAFAEREARINHPARWGTSTVLVEQVGLSPVLWLQDAEGYTIDRVAIAVSRASSATDAPMGRRFRAVIEPLEEGETLPSREELPSTAVRVRLLRKANLKELTFEDEVLFDGSLRPGEGGSLDGGRLVLEELRFWVGVKVVSERGGGFLVTGFVAGIVGLVWRLLLHRREVALTWDDEALRLVGRSENYPSRFRDELDLIFDTLRTGGLDGSWGAQETGASEHRGDA